jgi:hypothetical protein
LLQFSVAEHRDNRRAFVGRGHVRMGGAYTAGGLGHVKHQVFSGDRRARCAPWSTRNRERFACSLMTAFRDVSHSSGAERVSVVLRGLPFRYGLTRSSTTHDADIVTCLP